MAGYASIRHASNLFQSEARIEEWEINITKKTSITCFASSISLQPPSNITCVLKSSLQFWNNFDDVWYFPDKPFFSLRFSRYVSTSSDWRNRENPKYLTYLSQVRYLEHIDCLYYKYSFVFTILKINSTDRLYIIVCKTLTVLNSKVQNSSL